MCVVFFLTTYTHFKEEYNCLPKKKKNWKEKKKKILKITNFQMAHTYMFNYEKIFFLIKFSP